MTRGNRIKRIAGLARGAEKQAAQTLSKANHDLDACREQIDALVRYRAEYEQMFTAGKPLSGREACDGRRFLAQIDEAVAALEARAAHIADCTAACREAWVDRSRRATALEGVADTAQSAEAQRREVLDQHALDERSARALKNS